MTQMIQEKFAAIEPLLNDSSCRSGCSRATSVGFFSRRWRTPSNPNSCASPARYSPSPTPGASPSTFGRPARPDGWSMRSDPSPAPNRSSTTLAGTPTGSPSATGACAASTTTPCASATPTTAGRADSSRSPTTSKRRTRAVPRGAIGNRTTAPLVVVLHRSPDGGSRFGRAVGAHAGGRRNTGTPVSARCQVSPAAQTSGGLDADRRAAPFERNHRKHGAIVGPGRREGLGAEVVSGLVHDHGPVQVLTSADASAMAPVSEGVIGMSVPCLRNGSRCRTRWRRNATVTDTLGGALIKSRGRSRSKPRPLAPDVRQVEGMTRARSGLGSRRRGGWPSRSCVAGSCHRHSDSEESRSGLLLDALDARGHGDHGRAWGYSSSACTISRLR